MLQHMCPPPSALQTFVARPLTCSTGAVYRCSLGLNNSANVFPTNLVRVLSHGDAKGAGKPKVRQLERIAGAVDEQVLRLQVTVQNPATCQDRQGCGVYALAQANIKSNVISE